MDFESIAVPAVSAAGGGLTMAWVAKLMIQRWLLKNDQNHEKWALSIQNILIQLTRIEERVSTLQRAEERTHEQDRTIAVLQAQLAELKEDLNGVGRKVRDLTQ